MLMATIRKGSPVAVGVTAVNQIQQNDIRKLWSGIKNTTGFKQQEDRRSGQNSCSGHSSINSVQEQARHLPLLPPTKLTSHPLFTQSFPLTS